MLVPRSQLERIQVQLDNAATAFKGAKPERDALRKLLAASAAQAVDEDAERVVFEDAWLNSGFACDRLPSGEYLVPAVRFGWIGWMDRATRAAPVQSAPVLPGDFLSEIHDIAADGDPVSDSLVSNGDVLKLVQAVRTLQCRQILDADPLHSPQEPATGHAIPQWLRSQFDAIELDVHKLRAAGVFTQMRTKVQAYFEMRRSIERGKAGKAMFESQSAEKKP